ncbi:hypothetical protein HKT18_07405 [Flavobacterium sp. IMCC34852]|uniref:Signal peptidase n=1 Tax=Flavobacterium rivulicola TaxID=2732161 RepID=A0A7Y3R8S7_9FLAO|nr:hypothetical protein [Flavobacterium sp. IMCC34852]NNT72035.1 hypothetical protein [Flavobacterium sp. IMCC34852]
MKNSLKFYFVTLLLLAFDFVAFAQPGDDDGGGGLEGDDPQPAPIDSKLTILLIVGILFVFYTYKKSKRTI